MCGPLRRYQPWALDEPSRSDPAANEFLETRSDPGANFVWHLNNPVAQPPSAARRIPCPATFFVPPSVRSREWTDGGPGSAQVFQRGDDIGDFGAGGVVGVDVDEADDVVLVDDQDGGAG